MEVSPIASDIPTSKPKRRRRCAAKTRTGCITCKARHIRCDETKPYCSRCTTTGRKCEGYRKIEKPAHTNVPFAVKPISIFQAMSTPSWSAGSDGVRYLEFYHHCAGKSLSTAFDDRFWSRLAPQLAQEELAVRHALIALGYLNQTEPGSLKHAKSVLVDAERTKTLSFHYNKAIGLLVSRMSQSSYTPEIGLVTCLLFVCIEFLKGDFRMAFLHLKSGLQMLEEWRRGQDHGEPDQCAASSIFSMNPANRLDSGSVIRTEILPTFTRAISSALLYGVDIGRITPIHVPRAHSYKAFGSILDPQISGVELRNSTLQFLIHMGQKHFLRYSLTPEDFGTQARLLQCHQSWFKALEVYRHDNSLEPKLETVINSLKAVYYTTYISLACAMDTSQMPYDKHIDDFKALNFHAQRALHIPQNSTNPFPQPPGSTPAQSSSSSSSTSSSTSSSIPPTRNLPTANFTFGIRIIPTLFFAATRCRCPTTRRQTLSLLAQNLPREALWDAEQHVAVARRVMEIEESSVDENGWPSENTRLWSAVIDGDMDRSGGFWVSFAFADWVRKREVGEAVRNKKGTRTGRGDAQWEEWFVL